MISITLTVILCAGSFLLGMAAYWSLSGDGVGKGKADLHHFPSTNPVEDAARRAGC